MLPVAALSALELLEFYAEGGDMEPGDADQKINAYYQQVTSGLGDLLSQAKASGQLATDVSRLGADVSGLAGMGSQADWQRQGITVAQDALAVHVNVADMYAASPGAATTIMAQSGTGDTRLPPDQTATYPYTPEEILYGRSEDTVPATGAYTFTWTVGAACARAGWGFELLLPTLTPGEQSSYAATSSNTPPDLAHGSATIRLLAGIVALQTIISRDTTLDGPPDMSCPWQYSIVGPVST
jgi:hypothetical protein